MMKMHGQTTLKEIACIINTDNPMLINSMEDFFYIGNYFVVLWRIFWLYGTQRPIEVQKGPPPDSREPAEAIWRCYIQF